MKRFLIGTAGHIDHGKTALVKALTGIDADRLPEEKRRGITIDLGFAHAEWEGVRVSFVDVPGHEKFVRNMLAGAGGIEAVLLVVAADESVMPQTREHFEIVRLLGLSSGVIAVTKSDRAPPELVEVTVSDVRELVQGSFLEGAPIVPVSSVTGEGLDALRGALLAIAGRTRGEEREPRAIRLPIDRAFLIAGFGPVVTGSLVSGTVARDQKLELLPSRRPVRVRRVEVHGREEEVARAGERVSANLVGVELSDLHRGMVLSSPDALPVSSRLLVRLDLLPGAAPVVSGGRISFHHFATEARAGVRVLGAGEIAPGGSALVQLRLSAPVAAVAGDRFVARRLSPVETIGGGVVLDPLAPAARGRLATEALAALSALESGSLAERLVFWVGQSRDRGAAEDDLARRAGVRPEAVRAALGPALSEKRLHALRRSPDRYVSEATLARLSARATKLLAALLASGGAGVGVSRSTLLQRLLPGADPRWAEAVESAIATRGAITIAGDEARVPGRSELAGAERELSDRIATVFRERGLNPPSPLEAAEAVHHRPKVVEGIIGYLVKKGDLLRLPGGWFIARDAVDGVVARLKASGKPSLEVGEFKEMFGLTRRLAIPLLEYLDGAKITRRIGDRREIVR
ncbi:MAG TPA: selenocysteine-specific translation elongation factor [Thermoanaerobaculia bacterium]|jgi:selenocysteine-specific elongation factor|nr:selenocysteine-specific translation elongation factor [Thermoanaerobaculia bacterium]